MKIINSFILTKKVKSFNISIINDNCTNYVIRNTTHSNTSKINSISQDSYNYHESVKTYKVNLNQLGEANNRRQPEGQRQVI